MIPAGHRARTSYKSDIKILKLQIDSTGHNGIQNNCKFAIYRLYLTGYNANSIMRHDYNQFIHVNDRITLTNCVYRLKGLRADGRLDLMGISDEPFNIPAPFELIGNHLQIMGS